MEKKQERIFASILLIVSLLFSFFLLLINNQYQDILITYDDCLYKTYTVIDIEKDGNYIFKVKEEEKPLFLSTITATKKYKDEISNIKENDIINVYIVIHDSEKFSLEIVELSLADKTIISLANYIKANQDNCMVGFIIVTTFSLFGIIISLIVFFRKKPVNINDKITIKYFKKIISNSNDPKIKTILEESLKNKKSKLSVIELEKKVLESIYKKNGLYYTNLIDFALNGNYLTAFEHVMYDEMDDNEFKMIYDSINKGACFIFYKLNDKLASNYLFDDETTHKYVIDDLSTCFVFPYEIKMNDEEIKTFINDLETYNLFNDNILDIKINIKKKK